MADTTAIYGWPYQELTDPPDGSAVGQDLAEAIEATVDGIDDRVTALETDNARPVGRIVQGSAQSGIVNNTMTAVTFAAADVIDTHGQHDPASNNSRVTPNVAGIYDVDGSVAITGQTDYTGVEAVILFNGSAIAPATRLVPTAVSGTIQIPAKAKVTCNGSTDYFGVGFRLSRSGAGTSGTVVAAQFASTLEWEKVRD
jgi:hypothetical protein